MLLEQSHRQQQQITEIQSVATLQPFLIGGIDLNKALIPDITGVQLIGPQPPVLAIVDPGPHRIGRKALFIQIQLAQQLLQQPFTVLVVIDHEVLIIAQLLNLFA